VGVAVDVCERCRGVWFDRGELEKILAEVRAGEQAKISLLVKNRSREGDREEHTPQKRRRWDRLLELFD
jgi:Zn-finger nucleic acid-binding protein